MSNIIICFFNYFRERIKIIFIKIWNLEPVLPLNCHLFSIIQSRFCKLVSFFVINDIAMSGDFYKVNLNKIFKFSLI